MGKAVSAFFSINSKMSWTMGVAGCALSPAAGTDCARGLLPAGTSPDDTAPGATLGSGSGTRRSPSETSG